MNFTIDFSILRLLLVMHWAGDL